MSGWVCRKSSLSESEAKCSLLDRQSQCRGWCKVFLCVPRATLVLIAPTSGNQRPFPIGFSFLLPNDPNFSSSCCHKGKWTIYFFCDKSKVDNHSCLQIIRQHLQSKGFSFSSSFKLIISPGPMIYQTTKIGQFHPTTLNQKNRV